MWVVHLINKIDPRNGGLAGLTRADELTDDEYEKWLDPVAQSEEWKKKNRRLNNELWYVDDDRFWRQYPDLFYEPDDEHMGYDIHRTYILGKE